MKKIYLLLAALTVFAACNKEADVVTSEEPVSQEVVFSLSVSLPADAPEDTKATLGEAEDHVRKTTWDEGDVICVNGVNSNPLPASASGKTSAVFEFTQTPSAPFRVVYPAEVWGGETSVNLPALQGDAFGEDKAKGVALAGYMTSSLDDLQLKHLCSYVKIQMNGAWQHLEEVVITSGNEEQLSGRFDFDFTSNDFTLTPVSTAAVDQKVTVYATMDLRGDDMKKYCIAAIPAGTYAAGLNFRLIAGETAAGQATKSYQYADKKTTSSKTFTRANVTTMKVFTFTPSGFFWSVRSADDWNAMATAFNNGTLTNRNDLVINIEANLDFTGKSLVSLGSADASASYFLGKLNGNGNAFQAANLTRPIIAGIAGTAEVNDVVVNQNCTLTPGWADSDKTDKPRFTYSALIGYAVSGTVSNCMSNARINVAAGTVAVNTAIGGIVAELGGATIRNCTNGGSITIANGFSANPRLSIGGIAGFTAPEGQIRSCRNQGDITVGGTSANLGIGGIVAYAQGPIVNCTARNSTITATTTSAVEMGGIAATVATANVFNEGGEFANTVSNVKLVSNGATSSVRCGGLYGYSNVVSNLRIFGQVFTNGSSISVSNLKSDAGTKAFVGGIVGRAEKNIIFDVTKNASVEGNITVDTGASLQANMGIGGVIGYGQEQVAVGSTEGPSFKYTGSILLKTASKISYSTTNCSIGGLVGCCMSSTNIKACVVDSPYIGWPASSAATSPDAKTAGPFYVGGLVGFCATGSAIGSSTMNCVLDGDVAGKTVTSSNVTTLSSGYTQPAGTRYVVSNTSPGPTPGPTPGPEPATGLKFSVFGDSISTFRGYINGYTTYYPFGALNDVNMTYWMKLIAKFDGAELDTNISYSGSCVCYAEETYECVGSKKSYPLKSKKTKCFLTRYEETGIGNPDVLLLYGGTNDRVFSKGNVPRPGDGDVAKGGYYYSEDGGLGMYAPAAGEVAALCATADANLDTDYFMHAYVKLLRKIFAEHPKTKIVCIAADGMTKAQREWIQGVCDYYNAHGYSGRIKCVAFTGGSDNGKPPYDSNIPKVSGVHPNEAGMTYMANGIYNAIKDWVE